MTDRFRLAIFGVLSVVVAAVWLPDAVNSGSDDRCRQTIKECYRYIDAIQLWYVRPEYQNGNGRQNFAHFDAQLLGFSEAADTQEWEKDSVEYRMINARFTAFDFIAICEDGSQIEFRNIRFDSRPEYEINIE